MSRKTLTILIAVAVLLIVAAVVCFFIFRPAELHGSTSVYDTVTLQLAPNIFYDVWVPVEATLLSTDGATIYEYDLLTVGVQDTEPSSKCKVAVCGRWVFVNSPEGWLRTSLTGMDVEEPYYGTLDHEAIVWSEGTVDPVAYIPPTSLDFFCNGGVYAFGGSEFIAVQRVYDTYGGAYEQLLWKLFSLFKQDSGEGVVFESGVWITADEYTLALITENYNTYYLVTACGTSGREYAATLVNELE